MRNFNLLFLFCTLIVHQLLAQNPVNVPEGGCLPLGINTNPDNYVNPNDVTALRKWDWRSQNYTVYLTNLLGTLGNPITLVSPFYDQSGNINTFYLANSIVKDYNPTD